MNTVHQLPDEFLKVDQLLLLPIIIFMIINVFIDPSHDVDDSD